MQMSMSNSFTRASISRSSRGAARVPGPRATVGARPAVLPADLVEHQRPRAQIATCGDRPNQHYVMTLMTLFFLLGLKGAVTTSLDECRFAD